MQRARQRAFERLVAKALESLPDQIQKMLDNVEIVVEDEPGPEHLDAASLARGETLFGLYQGIPLTERGSGYSMVLPDKITIFRGPLERACRSRQELMREVRITVVHELGHHLGLDEERLEELGWA